MRLLIILFSILSVFLKGCVVIPESIKNGDEYLLAKKYIDALQAYEAGITEISDAKTHQEVEEKINTTRGYITDQYLAHARLVYERQTKVTVPIIEESIRVLEKGIRWDDQAGRIAATISLYQSQLAELRRIIAQTLSEAAARALIYHYTKATELIDQAIKLDPQNGVALESKLQIDKQKALYESIEEYLRTGDFENVFFAFERFKEFAGIKVDIKDFPLGNNIAKLISEKAETLTQQKRFYDAYILINQYHMDLLDDSLNKVKRSGGRYYLDAARSAVTYQSDHTKGYVYAVLANEMNANDIEVFNIHKLTQDHVDRNIQKYIAVASFDSPSNAPDAGKQFSDSLISYLYQVLPYGINILERDKIDYILKEPGSEARAIGEILGVDLIVTGTVSLYKVDKLVDERVATAKVKMGEETVSNPKFLQMVNMFGSDVSTWPQRPPETIQKENFQLMKYTKGAAQMKGFAKVSIRIFDAARGTIKFVKDFDATVVRESEFQDEVEQAGIAYVPLKLPTNTEIKEEMRKSIVNEVGKIVQASFENRGMRFLNQANFYLNRLEPESAFKPLAEGYFYCKRDQIDPDDPSFKQIKQHIAALVRRQDLIPKEPASNEDMPGFNSTERDNWEREYY